MKWKAKEDLSLASISAISLENLKRWHWCFGSWFWLMLHVCVYLLTFWEAIGSSFMLTTESVKPGQWRRAWKKTQTNWKPHRRQHYFSSARRVFFLCDKTVMWVTGSATTCRQTRKSEERRYRINIRFISATAFKHSRRQNKTKQNRAVGGGKLENILQAHCEGKMLNVSGEGSVVTAGWQAADGGSQRNMSSKYSSNSSSLDGWNKAERTGVSFLSAAV